MTATELRKQLFATLDSAASGNPAEFEYKGKRMRIVSDMGTSKLARLRPQSYTIDSEREMELATQELKDRMQSEWQEKWDRR